jgi:hypothetical protein
MVQPQPYVVSNEIVAGVVVLEAGGLLVVLEVGTLVVGGLEVGTLAAASSNLIY